MRVEKLRSIRAQKSCKTEIEKILARAEKNLGRGEKNLIWKTLFFITRCTVAVSTVLVLPPFYSKSYHYRHSHLVHPGVALISNMFVFNGVEDPLRAISGKQQD